MTDAHQNTHADASNDRSGFRAWARKNALPVSAVLFCCVALLGVAVYYGLAHGNVPAGPDQQTQAQLPPTADPTAAELKKQVADLQKQLGVAGTGLKKAAGTDEAATPATAGNTCDDGWTWDGSACVREARPSAEQHAASFVAMACKPGETRSVDRELTINGHKVHRAVTQTCEVPAHS